MLSIAPYVIQTRWSRTLGVQMGAHLILKISKYFIHKDFHGLFDAGSGTS